MLIIGPLITAAAAFVASSMLTPAPIFEATTRLLVGSALDEDVDPNELEAAQRVAELYVVLATSPAVLQRVIAEVPSGELTVATLQGQVSASVAEESPIITIVAETDDAALAADLANSVAAEITALSPTPTQEEEDVRNFARRQAEATAREIESTVTEVEELTSQPSRSPQDEVRLAALRDRLLALRANYAALIAAVPSGGTSAVTVLEAAMAEPVPTGERQSAVLGAILGLVLAVILIAFLEYFDDTVRGANDLDPAMRPLGTVGWYRPLDVAVVPTRQRQLGQEIGFLATTIHFATGSGVRAVAITSPEDGEGKTAIATHLAVMLARSRKVLLVDANTREPRIHAHFGLNNERGFRNLVDEPDLAPADVIRPTSLDTLRVVTGGTSAEAYDMLQPDRIRELMHAFAKHADLVLVDTAGVLVAPETMPVAASADSTILIADARHTRLGSLRQAIDQLARVDAQILGVVLNRVSGGAEKTAPSEHEWSYSAPRGHLRKSGGTDAPAGP